ncbi:MAG TPA: hypothetical protein VFS21_15700 [Roseiflexaceae bacterium]|nr:hypothetical protein [Roseiflexaceae bacterium]
MMLLMLLMALVARTLPYLLVGILVVSIFTASPLALVLSGGVVVVSLLMLAGLLVEQRAQRRQPRR